MLVEFIEPDPSNLIVKDAELIDMLGMPGERKFVYKVRLTVEAAITIALDSINLTIAASAFPPEERREKPNFSPAKFSVETRYAERAVQDAAKVAERSYLAEVKTEISSDIPNSSVSESKVVEDSSAPTMDVPRPALDPFGPAASKASETHTLPAAGISPSVEGTTPRQFRQESSLKPTQKIVFEGIDPVSGLKDSVSSLGGDLVATAASMASEAVRSAGLSQVQVAKEVSRITQPISKDESRNAQLEIFRRGVDPAAIGAGLPPTAIPSTAIGAIGRGISPPTKPSVTKDHILKVPAIRKIIFSPPPEPEPPQPVVIETDVFEITRTMVLREERLGGISKFYVIASLETANGLQTAKNSIEINHFTNTNRLLTPYHAPTLSASFLRQGQISVRVKQIDQQGTRVRLQRRKAPSTNCLQDAGSSWETVFEESLDINDGEIRFIDAAAVGGHSLMYRAVAIGTNGKSSQAFSTAVVHPKKVGLRTDIQGRLMNSVVELDPLATVATISPTDLPEDAISVSIRKFDLKSNDRIDRKRGKSRGFTYVGRTPDETSVKCETSTGKALLVFKDESLKPGGRYAYVPVAFTKRGKVIVGGETIVDIPLDAGDATKVQTIVDRLEVKTKDQNGLTLSDPTVTFNVEGTITDFGFEQIQSAIGESAAAGLFGGDTASQRSKFSELIQYEVVRTNQTTGQTESFGLMAPGQFSDNTTTRELNKVSTLDPGTSYAYTITTCVRSPESLFSNLVTADVDLETLQQFTKAVAKFRGPLQLRTSTLPSTARQKDPSIFSKIEDTNPFLAGRTSDTRVVKITIPTVTPSVSSVNLTQLQLKNELRWSAGTIAEASSFDHFRVYVTRNGARRLITSVHADNTTKDFEYTHHLKEPITRQVQYEVVPVGLNFDDYPSSFSRLTNPDAGGIIPKQVAAKSKVTKKKGFQDYSESQNRRGKSRPSGNETVQAQKEELKHLKSRSGSRGGRQGNR